MGERVDVWSFLLGLATISLAILIHEFGHYLVACWQGVKVSRFSLFFGPTLWEKTWKGTSFCLSLIPLGGYCQMERDGQGGLYSKNWLSKCLVSLAGPFANFVFGFLLLLVFFNLLQSPPVYDTQVVVLQNPLTDNPFYDAGLRSGDKLLAINEAQLTSFTQSEQLLESLEPGENAVLVYEREGKIIQLELSFSAPLSEKLLIPWTEAVLYTVAEELFTKFQPFDRIISIANKKINTTADLADFTTAGDESLLCVVQQPNGLRRQLELSYDELQILLRESQFIADDRGEKPNSIWLQSLRFFLRVVKLFFNILFELFRGDVALQNVFAGPLQTAQLIGRENTSLSVFIQRFSLLNFILALSNLIPLAGLDGGTLFFHTFELFLPQKKRNRARQLYALFSSVVILCLFIFIFSLDLLSFLRKP